MLRAVQTASKLSVRTNVVTKPSSKPAAKPSLPIENDAVRDPSHSDPLGAINEGGATNMMQVSMILPLLLQAYALSIKAFYHMV